MAPSMTNMFGATQSSHRYAIAQPPPVVAPVLRDRVHGGVFQCTRTAHDRTIGQPSARCHPASLSSCHPVILSSCHLAILSSDGWPFCWLNR